MSDDALTRKTETVALFSSLATGFDSGGAFAHFGQRLVEVVGIEPGHRVLDVASGRGAVLFPAIERVGTTGGPLGTSSSPNAQSSAVSNRSAACPVAAMEGRTAAGMLAGWVGGVITYAWSVRRFRRLDTSDTSTADSSQVEG